ncbi:MAG: biopolymer transporter ExbD [Gammaproteobacteria bacterium]|nr:biopolymer transporter ExbD [Gammaproteobacteria bacterium]
MRSKWRRRRRGDTPELEITAFMNLMVVLVPFLLITAVFSRLAIIELNLPAASSTPAEEPVFQLEVIVRGDGLEVGERSRGLLTRLPKADGEYDFKGLASYLQRVKASYPDMSNATILLEPSVPYDTLVQVMDALRFFEASQDGQMMRAELFPDISIGDAPLQGELQARGG